MTRNLARTQRRVATAGAVALAALLAAGSITIASAQGSAGGSRTASPNAGMRVVELALEATGANVGLPATDVGTASVRSCDTCKPASLLVGTRSRYLLDGEPVSLTVLRTALRAAPQASVVVMHARGGSEITRIIATSPPAMRR